MIRRPVLVCTSASTGEGCDSISKYEVSIAFDLRVNLRSGLLWCRLGTLSLGAHVLSHALRHARPVSFAAIEPTILDAPSSSFAESDGNSLCPMFKHAAGVDSDIWARRNGGRDEERDSEGMGDCHITRRSVCARAPTKMRGRHRRLETREEEGRRTGVGIGMSRKGRRKGSRVGGRVEGGR
eukprot:3291714-Rhodomonas_salina.1